jgi:hypothetical protein
MRFPQLAAASCDGRLAVEQDESLAFIELFEKTVIRSTFSCTVQQMYATYI